MTTAAAVRGVGHPHHAHGGSRPRRRRERGGGAVDEYGDGAARQGRDDGLGTALAMTGNRDEQGSGRHPVGVEGTFRR